METNTAIILVLAVFILWLAMTHRLAHVRSAWHVLLTGSP